MVLVSVFLQNNVCDAAVLCIEMYAHSNVIASRT
jgi:hypothetical protein